MKASHGILVAVLVLVPCLTYRAPGMERAFLRGDTFGDGHLDISDCIAILSTLFLGTDQISCKDAADVNDDGVIDLSDPVYELTYLFGLSAKPPPPPLGVCGNDPTQDSLDCRASSCPACGEDCAAPAACLPTSRLGEWACTTVLSTCEEVQELYAFITGELAPVCGQGETCRLAGGHCMIGLGGGCYFVASSSVPDEWLSALAARFLELGCVDPDLPICECPAPPERVDCFDSVCAFDF